jgi:hypothetical protein
MQNYRWAWTTRTFGRRLASIAGVTAVAVALGGAAFAAPGVTP